MKKFVGKVIEENAYLKYNIALHNKELIKF